MAAGHFRFQLDYAADTQEIRDRYIYNHQDKLE